MRTDYLYATPSFWSGVARLLDLFGQFDTYNDSAADEVADARALYSDWHIVGQHLADAMTRIELEPTTVEPPDQSAPRPTDRHS